MVFSVSFGIMVDVVVNDFFSKERMSIISSEHHFFVVVIRHLDITNAAPRYTFVYWFVVGFPINNSYHIRHPYPAVFMHGSVAASVS